MAENYCPSYKLVTAWRTSCDSPTAPMFMEDSLDSVHNPCVHSYVKVLTLPGVNMVDVVEGYQASRSHYTSEN